ncbi:hypothetical protein [Delftia acidovorans]|uniref:hypothetical protein n=1 Tax=Delftia acidovorans TaxID=80866 RepID=UPI0030195A49
MRKARKRARSLQLSEQHVFDMKQFYLAANASSGLARSAPRPQPALHDCSDSLRFKCPAFRRLSVSLGDRQQPGEAMIAGGSWTVLDGRGREIGRVEGDEFVRCGHTLIYRIEGPELYSVGNAGKLLGFIEGCEVRTTQGRIFLKFLAH